MIVTKDKILKAKTTNKKYKTLRDDLDYFAILDQKEPRSLSRYHRRRPMGGGPLNPAEDLTLYWHKASNLPRGIPDDSIVTDFTKLDWWPADPPALRIDRTDIYPTLRIGTTSDVYVVLPNHFVYGANHCCPLTRGSSPECSCHPERSGSRSSYSRHPLCPHTTGIVAPEQGHQEFPERSLREVPR